VNDRDAPYIEQWYRRFAEAHTPGQSELYRSWARGVAGDRDVLLLLCELPRAKRQPHLVFAVSRLLGAPETGYPQWREWMIAHWLQVRDEALVRSTQTNEPGRAAAFLPLLAQIEGPIALLEVGASAGFCLYPDRYSYEYDVGAAGLGVKPGPAPSTSTSPSYTYRIDPVDGPSDVVLRCEVTGDVPLPTAMPQIVWRAGIDLQPLDVTEAADLRWLQMLVGPEQADRRERMSAAAQIVRRDPPLLIQGDATGRLLDVAATAPAGATLVVLVVGVLVYLSPQQRVDFTDALAAVAAARPAAHPAALPAPQSAATPARAVHWISLEDPAVFPAMAAALELSPAPAPGLFPLALDGTPVAWCGPHGQSIAWI
jgi:hypothetical protein